MAENIDFKELKKELKDIEKLSKENLDIKTWASEIQLWIDLEEIDNPRKIFLACVLTSKGEPRKIIQELESHNEDIEDEDSDDEDDENENEENGERYPSLQKIIETLETFYGIKEDQNLLLREIRSLRIKRNEKVKDFNKRYRTLYLKLNKKKKKQVSVFDYADSLQNNREAWKRVSMKDDITLNKAFLIAEKVDRLLVKTDNENSSYSTNSNNKNGNYSSITYKRKPDPFNSQKKQEKEINMDELTTRMKNLTIKACFFCKEKGHYQHNCPKLNAIIEENKKSIYDESLNY